MSYRLRWYTDEGNLRSLGKEHLNRLLDRYADELAAAGIKIPETEDDETFHRELVQVFMRPEGIPDALHDALFHIKGIDNERGEDRLVLTSEGVGLSGVIDQADTFPNLLARLLENFDGYVAYDSAGRFGVKLIRGEAGDGLTFDEHDLTADPDLEASSWPDTITRSP